MAEGAFVSVSLGTLGDRITVTFAKPGASTWAAAYTYDSDKEPVIALTSEGYSGHTLGTIARTIGIAAIISNTVVSDQLVVVARLDATIHDDDTAITMDIIAGWVTDGTGDTSGAVTDQAITNASTLNYPKTIARWATVPYQRYTGAFVLEVVAFDKYGIDSIEVAVTVGATTVTQYATSMAKSTDDVYVYRCSFDASSFGDGAATANFKAYPLVGDAASVRDSSAVDVTIDPLVFVCNYGATLPTAQAWVATDGDDDTGTVGNINLPFATVGKAVDAIRAWRNSGGYGNNADGGEVLLKTGSHTNSNGGITSEVLGASEWVTVKPASGATVTLTSSATCVPAQLLAMRNLTVTIASGSGKPILKSGSGYAATTSLWLDNSVVTGPGQTNDASQTIAESMGGEGDITPQSHIYITDTSISSICWGVVGGYFCRGVDVYGTCDDSYTNTWCLINCTAENVDPGGSGVHSDAWQHYYGGSQDNNCIVYGFRATDLHYQGMFFRGMRGDSSMPPDAEGVAFVNVYIKMGTASPGGPIWGWYRNYDHAIWWYVTVLKYTDETSHIGVYAEPGYEGATLQNLSVQGCCFTSFNSGNMENTELCSWADCHYVLVAATPGLDYTTGAHGLDSYGRPTEGSALLDRFARLVAVDAGGTIRGILSDVGAYEYDPVGPKKLLGIKVA